MRVAGNESGEMYGIAVACPVVMQTGAVVVYGHRAVNDFIAAVAVDIAHAEIVVALSRIVAPFRIVGVENPLLFQFSPVPIPGNKYGAGIISPAHDDAWPDTVQISYAGQEAVAAVGACIAPAGQVAAFGQIVGCVEGLSGLAAENGQIFRAGEYTAVGGAMVGGGVTDDFSQSVDGAVSGFHYDFRLIVSVKIINHELGVVGAGADIASEIDAP